MFQEIWATCEIGEYLLSTVNPKVDKDGEAPDPIIDEEFHKIDPSIDNTGIKYLTANMKTLLEQESGSTAGQLHWTTINCSLLLLLYKLSCCWSWSCCCCCCCCCFPPLSLSLSLCCCWLFMFCLLLAWLILLYMILIFWRLEYKFFLHLRILWVNLQVSHGVPGSVCVCGCGAFFTQVEFF